MQPTMQADITTPVAQLPLQQQQPHGDAGPDGDQQPPLARLRSTLLDGLLEHVEDRWRADIAVIGEHVVADGDFFARELERLLDALGDAPPTRVHNPVVDVRAREPAVALQEVLDEYPQA